MVNSASQALAEFKSQRMGGLLSGTSSTVGAPPIVGTSLSDSASERLARSAPKKSTTAFLSQVRKSGQRYHETALAGFQAQRQAAMQQRMGGAGGGGGGAGYQLPNGGRPQTGGPRGAYGLTVPAASAFQRLNSAYQKAWGSGLKVNSGGRTREDQAFLYKQWVNRVPGYNRAAPPGQSLHETGIAIDLGGPIYTSNTKQHAWMRQNAANFGWYWVGQRYGEPHHWEYHPEWARK